MLFRRELGCDDRGDSPLHQFLGGLGEIKAALIDGGINFRTACDDAETLGAAVAHYVIDDSFQRLRSMHDDEDGDDDRQ